MEALYKIPSLKKITRRGTRPFSVLGMFIFIAGCSMLIAQGLDLLVQ